MGQRKIADLVSEVATRYPETLREAQMKDIQRIAYLASLILGCIDSNKKLPHSCTVMDVGGGIGMLSIVLSRVGFARVVLVDDFRDPVNEEVGESILNLHRSCAVEVAVRDMVEEGLPHDVGNFDVITFFDTIEHWHHLQSECCMKRWTCWRRMAG